MAADDFFARWSKRKMAAASVPVTMDSAVAFDADNPPVVSEAQAVVKPLPTQADAEGLTAESDYTAFLAKGVDESVKRCAMKKLFALPQFNIMDGLDIYVGDYSQPDPLPPGMLEALNHAKSALDPAQFFNNPVSQLLNKVEQQEPVAANPPETTELGQDAAESASATDNFAPVLPQLDALPSAVETSKNETV
ncbi:MAG: DUF3306 domain-containing protein [Glaciimonas sp.]|nr:DUF3306 domain-containing protein [Glaciimonas sp.]